MANATQEIAELIGGVRAGVEGSARAIESGVPEMGSGTATAAQASMALDDIQSSVREVNRQIQEIATDSDELKDASAEMVSTIATVEGIAEEATQSVQVISEVSEQNHSACARCLRRRGGDIVHRLRSSGGRANRLSSYRQPLVGLE